MLCALVSFTVLDLVCDGLSMLCSVRVCCSGLFVGVMCCCVVLCCGVLLCVLTRI